MINLFYNYIVKNFCQMKKLHLVLVLLIFFSCKNFDTQNIPKIAIIGLGIESSTFSPAKTVEDDFIVKTGNDLFSWYQISIDSINRQRANWIPTLVGYALPGGIVTNETYNSLVDKSLSLLKENLPYDGVLFDIHGAMSVEGVDDPEGDYIEKVREIIGKEPIISTTMDLHGNGSWRLDKNLD